MPRTTRRTPRRTVNNKRSFYAIALDTKVNAAEGLPLWIFYRKRGSFEHNNTVFPPFDYAAFIVAATSEEDARAVFKKKHPQLHPYSTQDNFRDPTIIPAVKIADHSVYKTAQIVMGDQLCD